VILIASQTGNESMTAGQIGVGVILGFLWVFGLPVICAMITKRRGRGVLPGALLGLFCGVFGLIIVLVAFKKEEPVTFNFQAPDTTGWPSPPVPPPPPNLSANPPPPPPTLPPRRDER